MGRGREKMALPFSRKALYVTSGGHTMLMRKNFGFQTCSQTNYSLWPQGKTQTSQPYHSVSQQNFLLYWKNIL